jgi:hypothetical protein
MSAAARLCAFGILLVALFLGARAVGLQLGPVSTTYAHTGGPPAGGGSGSMNMGTGPASGTRALLPVTPAAPGRR